MEEHQWIKDFPAAVPVCDSEGTIVEMNDMAREIFADDGGGKLVGTDVLDCHPDPSRSKLESMMAGQKSNVYSIKKGGRKYIVNQAPWYRNKVYAGFVEIVFEIPWDMPHHDRDAG